MLKGTKPAAETGTSSFWLTQPEGHWGRFPHDLSLLHKLDLK